MFEGCVLYKKWTRNSITAAASIQMPWIGLNVLWYKTVEPIFALHQETQWILDCFTFFLSSSCGNVDEQIKYYDRYAELISYCFVKPNNKNLHYLAVCMLKELMRIENTICTQLKWIACKAMGETQKRNGQTAWNWNVYSSWKIKSSKTTKWLDYFCIDCQCVVCRKRAPLFPYHSNRLIMLVFVLFE